MDWGKGILLTIIAFVGLILTLVVLAVKMDGIELVTENYYEEEIKYQERIDETNQALSLNRDVIFYDSETKTILLDIPMGSEGVLQLFRPSDSALDQELSVKVTETGKVTVPIDFLKTGYWKVKLTWSEGGIDHYQEKKINI